MLLCKAFWYEGFVNERKDEKSGEDLVDRCCQEIQNELKNVQIEVRMN